VETFALLGRRVGISAVRSFSDDMAPLLEVRWIDQDRHDLGVKLLLERDDEALSLVDAVGIWRGESRRSVSSRTNRTDSRSPRIWTRTRRSISTRKETCSRSRWSTRAREQTCVA
jgi:hypothetical protein